MGMAAAAWDVLSKAAKLAQVITMVVTVLTALLRVQRSNERECARLERCTRRLRALLRWPTTGGITLLLLCTETADPISKALGDAARLVDSYRKSTLWRRVRSGGSTVAQLRDMQDVVNSYCGLLLFVNAHLLLQQQLATRHLHAVPASSDTSSATIHQADDTSQSPTGTGTQIGHGGTDTDTAECAVDGPALLPIVISHT